MKLISLLPYILIAAGLLSTLALFLALKREIRLHAQRSRTRIEEMAVRLKDAERAPVATPDSAPRPIPLPWRAGLNLNTRVHALRMMRRGEDISHIAAALGVPRREVELMIRVQKIGKAKAAGADS
jgi:hypothetical protein